MLERDHSMTCPQRMFCDCHPNYPDNPMTCPHQMLCDYNTLPDGRITKPITWCNIEGYVCL